MSETTAAVPHGTSGEIWDGKPHPPAEESIAECIAKGLLDRDTEGKLRAVPRPGPRAMWSHCELISLVHAVWPDIPKAGVDFNDVLARAVAAREAMEGAKP